MKTHLRLAYSLVALVLIATAQAQTAPTDFSTLMGRTRQQLQPLFPGASNEIPNWNGFAKLYLFFNANQKLNQVGASFATPVSEDDAIKAVRERLGIDTSRTKPVRAPAAVRFESVSPAIKTVTLKRAYPQSTIEEITITYTLGYNQ